MTDIYKLRGITGAEEQSLRGLNPPIDTIEKLWQRIGTEEDPQITQIATQANVSQDRLIDLLAGQKLDEGRIGLMRPLTRLRPYIIDIAVAFVALVALSGLVGRALHIVLSPVNQVVVRNDAALPAGQVIGSDDVVMESAPWERGSIRNMQDVLRHYTLEAVPAGEKLDEDQVSESDVSSTDLEDRHLLTLPVTANALNSNVKPTSHVSVLFSPQESTSSTSAFIKDDVIVYGIKMGGDTASVVLAFEQDDIEDVKSVVSTSEAFILQPVRSLQ